MEYTLAEVRNGSGFSKDARFVAAPVEVPRAVRRSKDGATIWIPLPREQWREIEGGCACEYCSDNGKAQSPAYWDTLAVAAKAPTDHKPDYNWTVHYPELHAGAKPKARAI